MAEFKSQIRLLIADDHKIVRQGIRALLGMAKDIDVVGEARDGAETVTMANQLQPDIILMDIQMPLLDGIAATRKLTDTGSTCRVLMLSMRTDENSVRQAAEVGAWGYYLKNSDRDELIGAIRAVHGGTRVASPSVAFFLAEGK